MYTLNYKNYSIQLMLNLCIKKKKMERENNAFPLCAWIYTPKKFKKEYFIPNVKMNRQLGAVIPWFVDACLLFVMTCNWILREANKAAYAL